VAATAGGATDGGHAAVLEDYHARLVPPLCLSAVKSFFDGQGGWSCGVRASTLAQPLGPADMPIIAGGDFFDQREFDPNRVAADIDP
jgi:hypothetical protein